VVKIGDDHAFATLEHGAVVNLVQVNVARRGLGHGPALIPGGFDGRAPIVGGNVEVGFQFDGRDVGVEWIALAFGGGGEAGVYGVPGEVHGVAAHVADLAAAEVPIHVPLEAVHAGTAREVFRIPGMLGRGAKPQVQWKSAGGSPAAGR